MAKPKEPFESQLQRALANPGARAKIRQLVEDELFVIDGTVSKGRLTRRTGQGPKAKGRQGCESVKEVILRHFPFLTDGDVFIKATSMGGADLHLSDAALSKFNYAIEVKNSEALNVFKAIKQAELNANKAGRPWIVFFKRANSEVFVALRAVEFLQLAAFNHDPLTMSGTI